MNSDTRLVARSEPIRSTARKKAIPWAFFGLVAVFQFGTAPAWAQSFSATDSPWAGLKGMFGAKKPDVAAAPHRPATKASTAPLPQEAEDAEVLQGTEPVATSAPFTAKRAIWANAGQAQGVSAFINDQEMIPQDGAIYTSVVFDYTGDLVAPNESLYRSAMTRIRVPCSSGSEPTIVASTLFSGNSGDGKVVFESLQKIALLGTPIGQMVARFVSDRARAACQ